MLSSRQRRRLEVRGRRGAARRILRDAGFARSLATVLRVKGDLLMEVLSTPVGRVKASACALPLSRLAALTYPAGVDLGLPSYDFRLIDSILMGDSRVLAKQIGVSAMSRRIGYMAPICAAATAHRQRFLAKLGDRLFEPPADGGLWSSREVADWTVAELGLKSNRSRRSEDGRP
jgi:hypothetical protein